MIHGGAKGVLSAQGRSGGQSVVCGVGTSLARQMNGDECAGSRVFGMIRPGIGGGLVRDFGGLKRNRRVARTIETLRPLLADAEAPVGVVAKGQNKDRVMLRLRSRRTHRRLFGRWSRWSLPKSRLWVLRLLNRSITLSLFWPLATTPTGASASARRGRSVSIVRATLRFRLRPPKSRTRPPPIPGRIMPKTLLPAHSSPFICRARLVPTPQTTL